MFAYKVIALEHTATPEQQQDALNELGKEGWELLGVTHHGIPTAYFKRQQEAEAEAEQAPPPKKKKPAPPPEEEDDEEE